MYTRLLVPLDGSRIAEMVLPYSRFLAAKLNLPTDLLNAIDVVELGLRIDPDKAQYLTTYLEAVRRRSEDYLKGVANTFRGVPVNCFVEQGPPAETVIEKAAEEAGTLITMATHGYSGFKRWLLGSVAEKVLRGARNPLLLVRAKPEAYTDGEVDLGSVIVPLDGSELAEHALPVVGELAKRLRFRVILFRAYTPPLSALAAAPEAPYLVSNEKLIARFREEALGYLEKKARELKEAGVENVSTVAEYGLAADEIIAFARRTPKNLIAMSTHGRSGVNRWVLGSVTETVVRHSDDPVLVIRPE